MIERNFNAVASLVYRFFAGLDRRDHAGVAQLMAQKGVWQRQGVDLTGPAQALAALEQRDPRRRTAHTITNFWIETMTAETARVHYYLVAYETLADAAGREGEPQMLGVRDCTDELVMEDGLWRIQYKRSLSLLPAG